jgi:hypothetical protein
MTPEAHRREQAARGRATKLAEATRSYYTDQLGRDYDKAERNNRFKLARSGQMGGSEQVFQQGELTSDRDLGATRVDEAVRRAVAQLKTSREQERLSAINLVNSGAGDSAVSAAQTGLRNSYANAESSEKRALFDDLFAGAANSGAFTGQPQGGVLAAYQSRLSPFFQQKTTTSGRLTAS